jgi:hypothetical protein
MPIFVDPMRWAMAFTWPATGGLAKMEITTASIGSLWIASPHPWPTAPQPNSATSIFSASGGSEGPGSSVSG